MCRLLLLVVLATASAAPPPSPSPLSPHAPRAPRTPFGTFRSSVGRRLATEVTVNEYVAVRDSYSFTGPVAGLGFVDHEHDIVALNTTAFLDDYVDLFESVACAAMEAPTAADIGASHPLLPGEGDALRGRGGARLELVIPAGGATELFLHRMSRAHHVILGAGWEGAAPPACAALTSASGASTFAVAAVHATAAAGALRGGDAAAAAAGRTLVALTLTPAPLLAGFASARWRHHVDEDVHRALRARGETLHTHYPEHARSLGADTFYLFSQGLNWEAGAIVEPLKTLGTWAGAGGNASVRLQCEGCHAYFSSSITVELTFCAWARLALRTPQICLFGVCIPALDFGTVGVGPLGAGCDARHEGETGVGYHLALGARHDAAAGFGAGFRVTTDLDGVLIDVPRTAVVPAWRPIDFNFYLLGLPVRIGVELGLHASLKVSGYLHGEARTGVLTATGSTAHGFSFDQRVDGGRVRTIQTVTTDVARTPPTLTLAFGSSALRAELVPTVALVLYGAVRMQAAFPLRLQADLNHTAPDAVLCDLPPCALPDVKRDDGGRLLGVYITWQPRFALAVEAVRLRDLVAAVPLVGQYASRFVSEDFLLFPAQVLVADSALRSRQLIYAACAPAVVAWRGSGGGGTRRALAAAAPPLLLAQLEVPGVPPPPAAGVAPRARMLTSTSCGNYRNVADGAPGSWSGAPCSTDGCLSLIWIGGSTCTSTYTLSCSVGSAHTAGTSAVCTGTATSGFFGCNPITYSFVDDSYCRRCSAGQLCPGGQTAASSCPAGSICTAGVASTCPCGTYCPSGSVTATQCPVGFFCPARSAAPIACSGPLSAQLCPAGSCAQLSSSPSSTGTPSPSPSQTPSQSPTGSNSPTQSPTGSLTASISPSATETRSHTPTLSASATATLSGAPTASRSPSGTPPPTASLSSGATPTQSGTQTPSNSPTPSVTSWPSQTGTRSGTPSPSGTSTGSPPPTRSGTRTPPATATASATATPPNTPPGTPSGTGTASPSRLASPWPSCNRAPAADDAPLFRWPVFPPAPEVQRIVAAARQLRLGFSYLVTARGVATPANATELARLSAAAHGTVCAVLPCGGSGGPPGIATTVKALPRAAAAAVATAVNATVFNITWQMQVTVSSSLLAAADAALLTPDDVATFLDALDFARAQVATAAGALEALLAGAGGGGGGSGSERLLPMLDCATALAANADVAGALGCARALLPARRRLQAPGSSGEGDNSTAPTAVPLSFLPAVRVVSAAVGRQEPWPANVTLEWTVVYNYADLGSVEWVGPNGTNFAGTASPSSSASPAAALGTASRSSTLADHTGAAVGGVIAGVLVVAAVFVYRRRAHRRENPHGDLCRASASSSSAVAGAAQAGTKVVAHASRPFSTESSFSSSEISGAVAPDFSFVNPLQRTPSAKPPAADGKSQLQAPPAAQPAVLQAAGEAAAAVRSADKHVAPAVEPAAERAVAAPAVEPAAERAVAAPAVEPAAERALTQDAVTGAQPDPAATVAVAARGAGARAQPQSAAARRQYARVVQAQSNLASARAKLMVSSTLRTMRRADDMTEADAALMILRSWRLQKMRRVQAHFDKVAVFDK